MSISAIKWQTGEPKEQDLYIATTNEGEVVIVGCCPELEQDVAFFKNNIIAWCKLSDIEPYKEENQ